MKFTLKLICNCSTLQGFIWKSGCFENRKVLQIWNQRPFKSHDFWKKVTYLYQYKNLDVTFFIVNIFIKSQKILIFEYGWRLQILQDFVVFKTLVFWIWVNFVLTNFLKMLF